MNNPGMPKPNSAVKFKKVYRFILGGLIFLAVAALGCLNLSYPLRLREGVNHSHSGNVSRAFFDALMTNDLDLAQSVVIESQYPKLDSWFLKHEPFSCPAYWSFTGDDFLENPWRDGLGGCQGNSCEYYEGISCYRSGRLAYSFSIGSIKIQLLNTGWFVIDWDEVSECRTNCG